MTSSSAEGIDVDDAPEEPPEAVTGDEWGEWGAADEPADPPTATTAAPPGKSELCYPTLTEFVSDFLVEVGWVDTNTSSRIWCSEWWRHTAAIVRLDALHRSFEALRLDPALGMSTWLRDHLDPHMAVLTDPAGPLKGCGGTRGHDADRQRVLPCAGVPEGLFEPGD